MGVPGNANALLLRSAAAAGGYQVSRSLRFNSSDSAYLSRTPASAGNRKTFTWAGWVKRAALSATQVIFNTRIGESGVPRGGMEFGSADTLTWAFNSSGSSWDAELITTQVFRDVSAWYHFVCVADTTQATASERLKLYVNGVRITTFGTATYPSQNTDLPINSTQLHQIGRNGVSANYLSGYLADVHFIDGQALDPTSFTEVSATTGQLIPKAYTGSYGTNGFKLTFSDNSGTTSTTLGKDAAGSNNWSPNNFSVASGSGNDSLVDTPTSISATDTGIGGEIRGNYCTLNPLDNGGYTLANGNLDVSTTSASWKTVKSTIGVSSGKWYWEFSSTDAALGGSPYRAVDLGIAKSAATLGNYVGSDAHGWCYQNYDGSKFNNGSGSSYGATWIAGDVIGVALDADNGTLVFYKNGVSQGTAFTGLTSGPYFPAVSLYTGSSVSGSFNFGQRAFAYTAPSGFKALVDTNLTAPVIAKPNTAMDVKLYTGNASSQTISGIGFSPDLVWIKKRSGTSGHLLQNSVTGTGTGKALYTNTTGAEGSADAYGYLSAITSDGFTTQGGTDPSDPYDLVGANNQTYVSWLWDAGSSTVTNTQGSITSQVRANASAGFSIVTYTGTGANATVGHGLGVTPSFIIVKSRSNTTDWQGYHGALGKDYTIQLMSTGAAINVSNYWNGGVSSTTFGINGAYDGINANGYTYVAYCFSPVAGYSSFGSYTGNGSTDGPFVYTGFRPSYLLIKQSSSSGNNWEVRDYAREPYNDSNRTVLFPSSSLAELTDAFPIDFLSNGFKVRNTGSGSNESGATYIYAAFAESPFQFSRAR